MNSKDVPASRSKFSVHSRISSFRFAITGIENYLRSEPNAKLHLLATLVVGIAAWLVKVSAPEAALLAVATGMVWVTEMLNTCVEKIMDFISKERNPSIQWIKDVAAGAVLVAACIAVIIGAFIFIPKFL